MTSAPLTVRPLERPFDCTLPMPGSKSLCNRAIAMAALSPGKTVLKHMNPCDDVKYMVEGMEELGWDIDWTDDTTVEVRSFTAKNPTEPQEIFCGNAGTAVRFLSSIACLVPGQWVITGNEHMQQRPIEDLAQALRELGADVETTNGCPPLRITGGSIRGGTTKLDASRSSQFLTSLLQIAPALDEGVHIELTSELTSPTYVELTKNALQDFGVSVEQSENTFTITKDERYAAVPEYAIEGDWSAVGSFLVLAELTNSRLRSPNLRADSSQGDKAVPKIIQQLREPGDHTIDCTDFPDQLMTLCIVAAHREAVTTFTGAANLRHKECDRLAVITSELKKVGIDIEEHDDGVVVRGKATLQAAELDPHDDHRMAMCFAVLGSVFEGITIKNPNCVAKTYPHFLTDLEKLHSTSRCIAIIGMRASGKTYVGKRLAKALKLNFEDTDKVFEDAAGSIPDFIEEHGWDLFREGEEVAVAQCLHPNNVVSLGGGAVESTKTRQTLDSEAIVVWMESTPEIVLKHLGATKQQHRAKLTDLPMDEEVRTVMKEREPQYREASDISIPIGTKDSEHIPYMISALKEQCSW